MKNLAYALFPSPRLADRLGIARRPPFAAIVAFPLAALAVFLVWSGWLYPLRPDTIGALGQPFTADPRLSGAWGGPTLAGAWFVHAMAALGMQFVYMAVIRRLPGRIVADAV